MKLGRSKLLELRIIPTEGVQKKCFVPHLQIWVYWTWKILGFLLFPDFTY